MNVFTLEEAAIFLKVSKSTLYRAIQKGQVPAQKIGKQWRLSKDGLNKWLVGEVVDLETGDARVVPFKAYSSENRIKFIDVFCGIGGFRRPAEKLGMECVFSSDNDKFVQETYQEWYGERPFGDITEFTKDSVALNNIPEFDVLFAGFPCQPFSYAGKNEGFEDKVRGTLFFHVVKIIKHHQPKAVVLENVKGLKSHNKGQTIEIIRESLRELGYTLFESILNSYHFNVPQYRERWFCVAIRNDLVVNFDHSDFSLNKGNKSYQPKLKEIIDHDFDDDPRLQLPKAETTRIKYHFQNIEKYADGRVQHDNSKYAPETKKGKHGVYSFLKPNKTLRFHIGDRAKTQIQEAYYVHSDTYAPAIIANRRPKLWDLNRYLSVKECLALQGYPDDLVFPVSDAQAYKQLGNSICVPVAESVIEDMLHLLNKSGYDYSGLSLSFA